MNISKIAEATGLTAKAIRYYEEQGLIGPVRRSSNGYREYTEEELKDLIFIRHSRVTGFDLDEIRKLLQLFREPARHSSDVKLLVQEKITRVDSQLRHLQAMKSSLQQLAAVCAGNEGPQCAIIDSLAKPLPPK